MKKTIKIILLFLLTLSISAMATSLDSEGFNSEKLKITATQINNALADAIELSYDELITKIQKESVDIDSAIFYKSLRLDNIVEVAMKNGKKFTAIIFNIDSLVNILTEKNIKIFNAGSSYIIFDSKYKTEKHKHDDKTIENNKNLKTNNQDQDKSKELNFSNLFFHILPYIFLMLAFILSALAIHFIIERLVKGKKKNKIKPQSVNLRLNDVAGIDEVIDDVRDLIDFLKNRKKYSKLGGSIPRGVILYGEPGNGKTLLAKAIAGESGVNFLQASGSEFVEMYVGVGAARIRELFKMAKKCAPCVVFIDEIDAIARQRGSDQNGERDQALNQLLVEMDGFTDNPNVLVLAATNRLEILDNAILRPGRFDRHLYISKPTLEGRRDIFNVHLKKCKVNHDVSILQLSQLTIGFSGADIANLINEASIRATKQNKLEIETSDFFFARDKILLGLEKKSVKMDIDEIKTTTIHEIGHALMAIILKSDPVERISIIPRGASLGQTLQAPLKDKYSFTKSELLKKVGVLLGGRAAEELFIGDVTNGASHDLEIATGIIKNMITKYGMGESLGLASICGFEYLSDQNLEQIEKEVKSILNTQYKICINLLKKNEIIFQDMVAFLAKAEVMNQDDIRYVINGRNIEDSIA